MWNLKASFFLLCYFHTCIAGRLKFGPQGWNGRYPFSARDLAICVTVLGNNLETPTKVPWEDLHYLFGEITYGGHITDAWDRSLCCIYLQEFISPPVTKNVLDDILEMLPEEFNVAEIMQNTTAWSPCALVCPQECESMNLLLSQIHRSLK